MKNYYRLQINWRGSGGLSDFSSVTSKLDNLDKYSEQLLTLVNNPNEHSSLERLSVLIKDKIDEVKEHIYQADSKVWFNFRLMRVGDNYIAEKSKLVSVSEYKSLID